MITVFIGSATAAKSQARAITRSLTRPGLRFLPWWDAFTAGSRSFRRGAAVPVGKRTEREFQRWIEAL